MELHNVTAGWYSITALSAVSLLTLLVWRRYMSPISDIPGPFVASFTRLWHMNRILKGDQNLELIRLHEKHGIAKTYPSPFMHVLSRSCSHHRTFR
jgi:hypothetical protein